MLIKFQNYAGWDGKHSTIEQGLILHEKISRKYRIQFFHAMLRFRKNQVWKFVGCTLTWPHIAHIAWPRRVNNQYEIIIHAGIRQNFSVQCLISKKIMFEYVYLKTNWSGVYASTRARVTHFLIYFSRKCSFLWKQSYSSFLPYFQMQFKAR